MCWRIIDKALGKITCRSGEWLLLVRQCGSLTLNTAYHVMVLGVRALTVFHSAPSLTTVDPRYDLRDDPEGVVLLHSAPANTSQETLLHAALEPEHRDLVGRLLIAMRKLYAGGAMTASATYQLNIDLHAPRANPRENNPERHPHHIPEVLLPYDVNAVDVPCLC